LIKVNSPLSITNQQFFVNREQWNRLTTDDVENIVRAMQKFYRDVHTLQKPYEIPAYELAAADYPGDPSALPEVKSWASFHKRHPEFTSRKNYPHCAGFAALIGQYFVPLPLDNPNSTLGTSIQEFSVDAKACCRRCASMFDVAAARKAKGCAARSPWSAVGLVA
jgi:hypothetical protein